MSATRKMHGPWRIGADGGVALAGKGGFDEVVVGEWLHVERMSNTHFWLRIGERAFDVVAVGKGGLVKITEQTA